MTGTACSAVCIIMFVLNESLSCLTDASDWVFIDENLRP